MIKHNMKRLLFALKYLICAVIVIRNWVFRRGTDTMQLLNIGVAFFFFYAFSISKDGAGLDTAPIYQAFQVFEGTQWWLIMGAISLMQALLLMIKSIRCSVLSGFVLLVSAPMYTFISIQFGEVGYVNTGTLFYGFWAAMTGLAGWRMMDFYDWQSIAIKKEVTLAELAEKNVGLEYVGKSIVGNECADDPASDCSFNRRVYRCMRSNNTKSKA